GASRPAPTTPPEPTPDPLPGNPARGALERPRLGRESIPPVAALLPLPAAAAAAPALGEQPEAGVDDRVLEHRHGRVGHLREASELRGHALLARRDGVADHVRRLLGRLGREV